MSNVFPPLPAADLQPTIATVQIYAKLLGKIRRALTPRDKHWCHISLRLAATGLTTTPMPAGAMTVELLLDLIRHQLVITTSRGESWAKPLRGQAAAELAEETLAALATLGIKAEIDRALFSDTTPGIYEPEVVEKYWQALFQIDVLLKQFKGELRQETGPVQLWPHHIDLALLWFSGRLVPGIDPEDEESADEQMNFGFSPGDGGIPQPYFYITAYPLPNGLLDTPLPEDAVWHTQGFTGAILMYESLVTVEQPGEKLLNFWRTVQRAGANLMK
jgi:hypothetical protein